VRWDQSRVRSRTFRPRGLLHSCRCRDHCPGQCWCRRQRRPSRACLRPWATWRANRCRRCWAVQPLDRAGWKSLRQRWRRCLRCLPEPGRHQHPAERRGQCLYAPGRNLRRQSLLQEKVAEGRYCSPAMCRRELPLPHRCCRCLRLVRQAKEVVEPHSARRVWAPKTMPASACRRHPILQPRAAEQPRSRPAPCPCRYAPLADCHWPRSRQRWAEVGRRWRQAKFRPRRSSHWCERPEAVARLRRRQRACPSGCSRKIR